MIWSSKLQTEIALSTTAAEYVALSMAMREVLPLIELLQELRKFGLIKSINAPKVYCKVFEDNSGAIEIAKAPKMRPRTKYLNTKYHHFRDQVENGTIQLKYIGTDEQQADILTKAVDTRTFEKHRKAIMGW